MSRFGFLAIAIWLLIACGQSTPSEQVGGEDFPNTVADLGDTLARSIQDISEMVLFEEVESNVLNQRSLASSYAENNNMLAKSLAIADSIDLDWSDTANGILFVFVKKTGALWIEIDTLAVNWDQYAKDTIKDNEVLLWLKGKKEYYTGETESISYSDLDGDGFAVNPNECSSLAGSACQQVISNRVLRNENFIVNEEMHVSCGPDMDFDTDDDNGILYFKNLKTKLNGDTIRFDEAKDLDGDGWIVAAHESDSAWVEMHSIEWVVANKTTYKQQIDFAAMYYVPDTTQNRVIFYSEKKTTPLGKISHVWTDTATTGSSRSFWTPGDTVQAHRSISKGFGEYSDSTHVQYSLIIGEDWDKDSEVLSLDIESWPINPMVEYRRFSVRSENPIPQGEDPKSGTLYWLSEYSDNTHIEVRADFSPGQIQGVVHDRQNREWEITWDDSGEVIK